MRYTIGSILCTAYIIFCLLTQSAAGSWIIQRVNVPDIRDMAITYRNGHVIAESNTPEDINKFLDEIINRDDKSG